MRWVKQEHANGCVLASLAMVTGRTYREIHDYLAPRCGYFPESESTWKVGIDFSERGISFVHGEGMNYLVEHGYAVQIKYRFYFGNSERPVWPVDPWADMHIACVQTSQSHAVVLLRDGTVLDPLTEQPKRLSSYSKVESITGIWKVQ